jgi:uncharacterized protein YecE (DUF72 family)
MGQIYTEGRYTGRITKRTKKVGGKSFPEEVLPVESVREYFEHFNILEIDFTFYRPLLDKDKASPGQLKPGPNYHVLKRYRDHMKEGDKVLLKVPQIICAKRLYRSGKFIENESFLSPDKFLELFYEPATGILGPMLEGFIFEQEYHRKKERIPPEELATAFDAFFSSIPSDRRYHLELRTEAYLRKPLFEVMKDHQVGQVLSHWTWLPGLLKQFEKTGGQFINTRNCIIRLITPIGMRYEEAYSQAHPFDKLVDGMLKPEMVEDTVTLIRAGMNQGINVVIIVNNRAGGNAPSVAGEIMSHYFEA